jgi:6-phosphogluconolactonase
VSVRAAPTVHALADADAVSTALADAVITTARERIASDGRFTVALAGGDTPRSAYELLGARHATAIDWSQVHVFFSDERWVAPDDPRNNAAMAARAWLSKVAIPAEQVHAIPTRGTPDECADAYERTLRGRLSGDRTFDLAIMGMGADGHTASLFPGDARALSERTRWVLAVNAPPGTEPRQRITLTLPVLNASRRILFAVVGAAKRDRVREVLGAEGSGLPAALVQGRQSTEWLLDAAAS